jgi:hypothetical protein
MYIGIKITRMMDKASIWARKSGKLLFADSLGNDICAGHAIFIISG